MRQDKLTFLVFLIFDENFHSVADFDFGIVAEFVHRDDTVALVSDVNHSFAFVERDYGTFDYVFVFDGVERFVVGFGELFTSLLSSSFAIFVGFPIEVCEG